MQVEQIDREAGADFMGSIPAFHGQEQPMRDGLNDTSLVVQSFARHRHQVRAEVVGEIVAWLREPSQACCPAKTVAEKIEANFGTTQAG